MLVPPVKARAQQIGAPVLQPTRARDENFIEALRAFAPDAIAVVAYGQILPRAILDMAPRGCVNLHFSLLPRWRGAAPVQYAIWNGDKTTGVTTQWMAEKLDAGDIIQQLEVPIEDGETSGALLERLTPIGARVLSATLAMLESGTAPRAPQQQSSVTLAPQVDKNDVKIEWTMDARKIVDTVRAWNPWPVAWVERAGEPLKIWRAQTVDASGAAGTVLSTGADGVVVAAGAGAVYLMEVQAPGKPRMSAKDWSNGARLEVGKIF